MKMGKKPLTPPYPSSNKCTFNASHAKGPLQAGFDYKHIFFHWWITMHPTSLNCRVFRTSWGCLADSVGKVHRVPAMCKAEYLGATWATSFRQQWMEKWRTGPRKWVLAALTQRSLAHPRTRTPTPGPAVNLDIFNPNQEFGLSVFTAKAPTGEMAHFSAGRKPAWLLPQHSYTLMYFRGEIASQSCPWMSLDVWSYSVRPSGYTTYMCYPGA